MITKLGKALRKIRIDKDESLADMAENLGISSSYLSAIENGNRIVPDGMLTKLWSKYVLSDNDMWEILRLMANDRKEIPADFSQETNERFTEIAIEHAKEVPLTDVDFAREFIGVIRHFMWEKEHAKNPEARR